MGIIDSEGMKVDAPVARCLTDIDHRGYQTKPLRVGEGGALDQSIGPQNVDVLHGAALENAQADLVLCLETTIDRAALHQLQKGDHRLIDSHFESRQQLLIEFRQARVALTVDVPSVGRAGQGCKSCCCEKAMKTVQRG